ncbi:MAG: hypothetical protein ACH346_06550, partial [Chthoniobacterales bacterium]
NLLREEKDRLSGLEGKTRADLLLELCDEALERGSGKLEKISLPGDAVERALDQFLAGASINLPNDLIKALEHIAIPDVPLTGITGILFSTLKWAVKKDQTIYKDSLKDILRERLKELKNDEETINDLKKNATKLTQEVRQVEEDAADKERRATSNFAVSMKSLFTNNTDVPQAVESIRWAQGLTERANISDEDQQTWSAIIAEMGLKSRDRLLTFVISAWRQRMSSSQELVETIKKNQQEEMSPLERERDRGQQDLDQAHAVAQEAQEAFKQATEDYLNCEKEHNKATEEYSELVSHPLRNTAANIAAQREGQEKIARLAERLSHTEEDWKAKEKNAKETEETAIKEESKARRVAAECHNRGERYARAVARAEVRSTSDQEAWKINLQPFWEINLKPLKDARNAETQAMKSSELAQTALDEALDHWTAAASFFADWSEKDLQKAIHLFPPSRWRERTNKVMKSYEKASELAYQAEVAWGDALLSRKIMLETLLEVDKNNITNFIFDIDSLEKQKIVWAEKAFIAKQDALDLEDPEIAKEKAADTQARTAYAKAKIVWDNFSQNAQTFIQHSNDENLNKAKIIAMSAREIFYQISETRPGYFSPGFGDAFARAAQAAYEAANADKQATTEAASRGSSWAIDAITSADAAAHYADIAANTNWKEEALWAAQCAKEAAEFAHAVAAFKAEQEGPEAVERFRLAEEGKAERVKAAEEARAKKSAAEELQFIQALEEARAKISELEQALAAAEEETIAAQAACNNLSLRQRLNLFGTSSTANSAAERLSRAMEAERDLTQQLAAAKQRAEK